MTNVIPTSAPKCQYEQEIRFAVVMYGGVSLAIYINGIAQEMYHMVRSTAPADSENPDAALFAGAQLSGTERVYRKLGQMLTGRTAPQMNPGESDAIRTRFVIDILSGTSAGGINAIFLAKALANNQSLEGLKQLWVEEGDLGLLLNDKESVHNETLLSLQSPAPSLLNSKRMYLKLLKAFDAMEPGPMQTGDTPSPYANELDLFVTTTDIQGVALPIRLTDKLVYERRHKNVFHFRYFNSLVDTPGDGTDTGTASETLDRNDFIHGFNPFLAFAARCTSSFPFAFEAMQLSDIDDIVKGVEPYRSNGDFSSRSPKWDRFLANYPQNLPGGDPETMNATQPDMVTIPFHQRSFGDGGYLDNKPFSYAIDALTTRQAGVPVDRKLIYVEPAPEHPEDAPERAGRPDAMQNVMAATLVLPRYETIREDLQRVLQRNSLVERVNRITKGIEVDVKLGMDNQRLAPAATGTDWARQDIEEMIKQKGVAYGGYQRLKVGAVTDEIAELIARASGLDEDSDQLLGIRYLVRAWRSNHYTVYYKPDIPKDKQQTENKFLLDFDYNYRLRRLTFVQGKLDMLYAGGSARKEVFDNIDLPIQLDAAGEREFMAALKDIRTGLNQAYVQLALSKRRLAGRLEKNPMYALTIATGISREQIRSLLEEPSDERRYKSAADFVTSPAINTNLQALAAGLAAFINGVTREASRICSSALDPGTAAKSSPTQLARQCLWHYYQYYDDYDMITFPVLYSTGTGEMDTVEIIRISPEDATSLIDERKESRRPNGRHKLAGTVMANFGAFLDRVWRQNDILWGRLDGAERIITTLLPGKEYESARADLIREAQEEILKEDLKPQDRLDICKVLAETIAKSEPHEDREKVLRKIVDEAYGSEVDAKVQAVFRMLLDEKSLLQYFKEGYEVNRNEDPESMLKIMSRSSRIIGGMLEGLADNRRMNSSRVAWVAKLGEIFWGIVIVAVPGSLLNLIFKHWLKVLYTFEILLIVFGTLLLSPMQKFGLTLLGITAAVHLIVALVGEYMQGKSFLKRLVIVLLVGAILVLAGLGVDSLCGRPVMDWIEAHL